jgi:hypothetical protein
MRASPAQYLLPTELRLTVQKQSSTSTDFNSGSNVKKESTGNE